MKQYITTGLSTCKCLVTVQRQIPKSNAIITLTNVTVVNIFYLQVQYNFSGPV